MEFGPAALPLDAHREDLVFIRGLYNHQAVYSSTSPHLGRMNMLSGATVSLDPNEIRVGTTMDQVIARESARIRRCPAWRSASSPTSCASKTACR